MSGKPTSLSYELTPVGAAIPTQLPLTEVVVKIGSKKVADVKGVKKIKKGIRKNSCADWRVASLRLVGLPDERCSITGVLVWLSTELMAVYGPGPEPGLLS
jgi:hypothetical protein